MLPTGTEGTLPDLAEKRLTSRITKCWEAARPNAGLPTLDGILQQYIGDLWEAVFIVELDETSAMLRFTEIGDIFRRERAEDYLGLDATRVPHSILLHECTKNLDVAFVKQAPSYFSGEYVGGDQTIHLYRSALFPLASKTEGGIEIMGAGWFRAETATPW